MNKVWIICKDHKTLLNDDNTKHLLIRMFGLARLMVLSNSPSYIETGFIAQGIYDARSTQEPVTDIIVDAQYKDLPAEIIKSYITFAPESCQVRFWFLEPRLAGAWGIKPALMPYTGDAANEIDYTKINL